jgi:7-keto-8-aminopelargonate synthetase-like enzyme
MKSIQTNQNLAILEESFSYGIQKGVVHLISSDQRLQPGVLHIHDGALDKTLLHFGSCSYLGLEFDNRLRQASKNAIDDYGTTFSSSRTYISCRYYEELETLLEKIFNGHVVVAPTTTLGHLATIPAMVRDEDAILLDHQVHHSVQMAVNLVKSRGVYTEMIRHNRMDILEDKIKSLREKHRQIWYMADGIYSMFGDTSPVKDIYSLLDKYSEFRYYVDDAHGMSCFGEHGSGYILSKKPLHEQMILAVSFAKAFGGGGAALVFPNKELALKIRTSGGPMMTSGPVQPAALGANLASAKIHLSPEINLLQAELQSKIQFAKNIIRQLRLPLIHESDSPIFFIGLSLPKLSYELTRRMIQSGYFLNIAMFPVVPVKNAGIRFTINRLMDNGQIESMLQTLAFHYNDLLIAENMETKDIYKAFRLPTPVHTLSKNQPSRILSKEVSLSHYKTIEDISAFEWDSLLGNRANFDWEGLRFFENSFRNNILPEDNWEFDYIMIRDEEGNPVVATFITTTLCKDDMLAPKSVSMQIEKRRRSGEPYLLISKMISTGSPLSAGNHIYIDRTSQHWKQAMHLLLDKLGELLEKQDAQSILLRDLPVNDPEMNEFLTENGFFKVPLPENLVMDELNWNNDEEYLSRLSRKSRIHIKQEVWRHTDKYEIGHVHHASAEQVEHFYQLYLEISRKSFEINTFALPFRFFENIARDTNWEIMTLQLKPEFDSRKERKPVAVAFFYRTPRHYNALMVGMDYSLPEVTYYRAYKQIMYQGILRARELNLETLQMGYTASQVKKMLGAHPVQSVAYMQCVDNYSFEMIATLNAHMEQVK